MRFRVTRAFTHEGRALSIGDSLALSPIEAAVLHRRGCVSLSKVIEAEPKAEPEPEPRKRRTYKRRDLEAE